ncbi:MAG: SbcC/MukB-like Walker B domain-containing protein, partial [Senegalimassilia anaerobia]
ALQQECAHDAERLEATERAAVIEGTFSKYQALQRADQGVLAAKEALLCAERASKAAQVAAGKAEEQRAQAAQAVEKLAGSDVRQAQAKAAFDAAQLRVNAAGEALAGAKDLAAKVATAQKAQKQVQTLLEQEESLVAAECKAQDAVARAKTASESFAGADVALSEAGAALERAMRAEQDAYQAVQRRGELQQATQAAAEPYQRALERLKAAEIVHDKDLAQVQQLQKAQRAGRAGLLAADLRDGSPCPVCGSVHHPAPARAEGNIPSDDQIDKATVVEAASKKATDQAAREAEGAKAHREAAQLALDEFDKEHGGEQSITQALAQARDGVAAAKRAKADAQLRCDEAAHAAKALADAESAHERSVTALSQVKDARQAAERDHASANAEARALKERLAVVSVDEAQCALENAQHDASVAQTELNNAERAVSAFAAAQRGQQAAEEAAKQAAEQARKAEEALRSQTQAQQLAEQEAKHLRADLDFPSLEAAQTEAARLRQQADALKRRRDAAQQAVEQNAQQLATKRELLAAKDKQLAELPAGDAVAAANERNDYEEQGKLASERLGAVNLRVSANRECLEQLRKTLKRTGDIEDRYGRIKLMADAANGNLTGRAKVRFEAYVQGMYFDKVIAAANQRLRVLTAGQFELVRWSESTGNSKAGLGLYVIDSFTGRARDASSLSGGESFQASLCLALGLSDIVQAHAGGIEFDTMFVDEGFGSLDQGALGNAISLLSDLSGGNKLVGIISHVEDLKANIPKRITVTKTQSGSTAKVEA